MGPRQDLALSVRNRVCWFRGSRISAPLKPVSDAANRIRLLRIIPSMLLLPVFISVSRKKIIWVGAIILSLTDAVSQDAMVGSAQPVVVARAWASHDVAVQHCFEYIGS